MKIDPRNSFYTAERERLLREIAQREAQLDALNASFQDTPDRLISEALSRKRKFSAGSYYRFIILNLKESKAYGIWERLLKYFRRFRLITSILKIVSYIITLISTGAFLISFLTVIIIAAPFALIAALIGVIYSFWYRRIIIQHLRESKDPKNITVIFLPANTPEQSSCSFTADTATKLSDLGDWVFIVRQLNSRFQNRSSRVFCINQQDYFFFNKHLFSNCETITHIHL